jgi:CRISPR type III-B/RAMP module-associated protein Cmr3
VSPAAAEAASKWLAFTPRDTVFVRDGRSFDAAADAFAQAVRPGPTTIAGAVGAAFRGVNPLEVRGPVLARREGDEWEPYFPVPADLVATKGRGGRIYRLSQQSVGSADVTSTDLVGTDLDSAEEHDDGRKSLRLLLPPEHAEPAEPAAGDEPGRKVMPGRVLAEYLKGTLVGEHGIERQRLGLEEPLRPEQRVGLARDGRKAREGFLYQAEHLRPEDGWAFLAQYTVPEKWSAETEDHVPFGGRGRLADIQPAVARWPDVTQTVGKDAKETVGKQVLVYLATPGLWRDGWRLPVPAGAALVAAALYEPEPLATVKPGRGYLDTRRLWWVVPAGSVYFLEFDDAEAGTAWARTWNGVALDRGGPDEEQDLLRTAGFGVALTGAWT